MKNSCDRDLDDQAPSPGFTRGVLKREKTILWPSGLEERGMTGQSNRERRCATRIRREAR